MTTFEQKARLEPLIEQPGAVLCAVSGGADSMALLQLLCSRREELGITLRAAHFEHGLRGEESLRDAAFVERFCAERGIPCTVGHGDVRAWAASQGKGEEEAARELRYAFLERTARESGCRWILTAHTADDNAETLLINLCRGAGAAGLSGIPPRRGKILRPLLACTRADVEVYLRENSVPHIEDSSNQSDAYRRNLLRHRVMPVLRECNPSLSEALLRTSELLRQDEDFLSAEAERFIQSWYDGESLPAERLGRLHPAVASRVLRRLCQGRPERQHVQTVLRLCREEPQTFLQIDVPGQRLTLKQGRLSFTGAETPPLFLPDRAVEAGRTVEIPEAGLRVRAELASMGEEVYDLFKTLNIKYENICGKLYCTGRRAGDKLHPAGRGCGKSLKALFQEAGLDRRQRQTVPLFRDERGLLAIYGLALDERAAARPGDRVLRLHVEPLQAERETDESGH